MTATTSLGYPTRNPKTGQFQRRKMPPGMKYCPACQTVQDLEAFSRAKDRHDGRQSRCRKCNAQRARETRKNHPEKYREQRRRADVKAKYGIALEEYTERMASPCAICGRKDRKRVLDHCHTTGALRGTLCDHCNRGIGLLGDDAAVLASALSYLT